MKVLAEKQRNFKTSNVFLQRITYECFNFMEFQTTFLELPFALYFSIFKNITVTKQIIARYTKFRGTYWSVKNLLPLSTSSGLLISKEFKIDSKKSMTVFAWIFFLKKLPNSGDKNVCVFSLPALLDVIHTQNWTRL